MRVTVVSRIYRPEPSAASIFHGSVVDALLADGHHVEVMTACPPSHLERAPHTERVRGFPVLRDRNGYVRGILQYLSFDIPLLFRLMFAPRADVVLVEPPPTTGAVVRLVCGLRRIPYVYNAADVWSDAAQLERTSPVIVWGLRKIERFALRGAAHIVTISDGVVERLRAFQVRSPVTVTGFGADLREFPLAVAPPERLFVYAGSYAPAHGAEMLVDGLAELLQTHPGFTLRFIGNGVERPAVERRALQLGVSANVEYLDPVAPSELLPHLGAAVAGLATIKPATIYEYSYASKVYSMLAAGCPVIFAGPGPTNELLETANEYVRAGATVAYEPEAIAAAMREMIEHPASQRDRAELSRWAAATHSMAAVAGRVVEVLTGVVERRS